MTEWTPPAIGAPVWVAIPATDVAASKAFYSAVLSWEFKPIPAGYSATEIAMFSFPGLPNIGGGINRVDKIAHTSDAVALNHYMVESIEKTQGKIVELGGKVLLEKTPEGQYGLIAKYEDPQGAQFAVYQMMQ